jgi:hypoxanthine phosphoribosyltransferase
MSQPSLEAALKTADCLYDRQQLDSVIGAMGRSIAESLRGETPVFLTIMNGGLIFGAALALAIPADLEFDYVHATRYHGGTRGSELLWIKQPRLAMRGRVVLLADDILDEGARRVLIAVLCRKQHDRAASGVAADWVGVDVPDRYVFGFGMDFHEQGRNLPGIYALKES